MPGTITSSLVDLVVEVCTGNGVPREAMRTVLGEPSDGRFPIERLFAAWEIAMRATQLVDLPLRVGRAARFDRYGVFGYALYVSSNAEHAFRRLCRYHDVLTDSGQWRMRREGDNVVLAWDRAAPALGARVANEQVLAAFVGVAEQVMATSVAIVEVRHRHPAPASIAAHEQHYRAPVRFSTGEDAIVLPAAYLEHQPVGSDPHLDAFFAAQLQQIAPRGDDEVDAVARIVLAMLPDGLPAMAAVAQHLETSERTLRRRLADRGQTFEALVESLQRERATSLLAGEGAIGEIALAVGFADASAFTRAFRRWNGMSPSEYRRSLAR